ncbi:MAG: hypothetical protein VW271_06715, partial [Chloroflexota bacterium]
MENAGNLIALWAFRFPLRARECFFLGSGGISISVGLLPKNQFVDSAPFSNQPASAVHRGSEVLLAQEHWISLRFTV